jgi:hypothetical protein
MSAASFALLDTQYGEDNKIQQPRAARAARGPHKYDPTIINNKIVGYVAVPYTHQEYPKALYHPEYGMKPMPDAATFQAGAVTAAQIQNASQAFQTALEKWHRGQRIQIVTISKNELHLPEDEQLKALKEREERLIKKGWLPAPPKAKDSARFDMASEEI